MAEPLPDNKISVKLEGTFAWENAATYSFSKHTDYSFILSNSNPSSGSFFYFLKSWQITPEAQRWFITCPNAKETGLLKSGSSYWIQSLLCSVLLQGSVTKRDGGFKIYRSSGSQANKHSRLLSLNYRMLRSFQITLNGAETFVNIPEYSFPQLPKKTFLLIRKSIWFGVRRKNERIAMISEYKYCML